MNSTISVEYCRPWFTAPDPMLGVVSYALHSETVVVPYHVIPHALFLEGFKGNRKTGIIDSCDKRRRCRDLPFTFLTVPAVGPEGCRRALAAKRGPPALTWFRLTDALAGFF